MVDAGIFALGSILSAVTVNAEMLLLSRTLALLAMAFVWRFLPETKNLSVEEVVAVFERQATGTRANALDP